MDTLLLVGGVVAGGVWLLRHLSTFNRRVCPKCNGTGKVRSSFLGQRFQQCPRCGGQQWIKGWGGRPE